MIIIHSSVVGLFVAVAAGGRIALFLFLSMGT